MDTELLPELPDYKMHRKRVNKSQFFRRVGSVPGNRLARTYHSRYERLNK